METEIQKKGEVILYHPSETIKLEVRLENETVWLNREQLALLFDRDVKTIGKHINNALKEELAGEVVVAKFATTTRHGAIDGKIQIQHPEYYNLEVITSVGYRVKSKNGIKFRRWANSVLKQFLTNGYVVNNNALASMQKQIDDRFISFQEYTDTRLQNIQRHLERHDEQIELYIKTNEEPKEQLFGNGCVFDAWNYISDLVRSAKREIVLIDNYVDDTVLAILSKREKGVKATIHSRYRAKFITDLEKYNKQFPDAEVDFIQFSDKNHDRFLIIDDDVYMLGNSVKDFGNAWGVVIRMEMSKTNILAMV